MRARRGQRGALIGDVALRTQVIADTRTGKDGRHSLIAQLRQSVFGRLAGYEDVKAVPQELFGRILDRVARLRAPSLARC